MTDDLRPTDVDFWLRQLVQAKDPDRVDWFTSDEHAFQCFVCGEAFPDFIAHRESHEAEAKLLHDRDLRPLSWVMRQIVAALRTQALRTAEIIDDVTVTVADCPCIPRMYALLLMHVELPVANVGKMIMRLRHDVDFAAAMEMADVVDAVFRFIDQQESAQ